MFKVKKSSLCVAIALTCGLASSMAVAQSYEMRVNVAGLVAPKVVPPEPTHNFVSHTFTNCWQSGRFGPSLSQCQAAYSGSEIMNPGYGFGVSQGIQGWTVPEDGDYRVRAFGAAGGAFLASSSQRPGRGASISGIFTLQKGKTLYLLAGQRGGGACGHTTGPCNGAAGGGGGGGSFVTDGADVASANVLIVASGGNGQNWSRWETNGPNGRSVQASSPNGGLSGERGSGGGGLLGNGGNAPQGDSTGGQSRAAGGAGGLKDTGHREDTSMGGFGGGGGSRYEGGGGGGYSGGRAVPANQYTTNYPTYGASSFNTGASQVNQSGANTGHGSITITLIK
jgi:hypothetical protein